MKATDSDIYLGLANIVALLLPNAPVFLKGMANPSVNGKDEWAAFELLYSMPITIRKNAQGRKIAVQITAYSAHAEHRADKKVNRVYELGDIYKEAFHQKDILLKSSCIQFKESIIKYIDLRSLSDFSKQIYQNSPPLHLMASVIITEGIIIDKE
jgi:hypothetical protein